MGPESNVVHYIGNRVPFRKHDIYIRNLFSLPPLSLLSLQVTPVLFPIVLLRQLSGYKVLEVGPVMDQLLLAVFLCLYLG